MTGSNPTTAHLPFCDETIVGAAALIRAGACVAVPTETVYGLAADATNAAAVAGIYAAKGRPDFNPLIVHVADWTMAETLGQFDEQSRALAHAFWPGPLTIVVPRTADCSVASIATAGLDTIALRCPAHGAMQALIAASGCPLAAPSANISGTVSPTSAAHVLSTLEGRIPMIIDAGPCAAGLESTIVRVVDGCLVLLRPGPVTPAMLVDATGLHVCADASGTISAPGQLASHYAPGKPVLLNCETPPDDCFVIGFGSEPCDYQLSACGSLEQAAARLFDALHAGAASANPRIAIAPIPDAGLGLAINDRLRRAAA
ncbi:MAG: L-threonylcarbamoyladenylate synthase [Pseudomonadota bacterium]